MSVVAHTITLAQGKQFTSNGELSLLDAALAAGYHLEHSCRTGRCGTCKTRVTAGQTRALQPDLLLSAAEHALGYRLTCTEAAASDVRLEAEDLTRLAGLTARTYPARIDSLARLADDVLHLTLRLPPTADLAFAAGQYVNLIGPGGMRRSYSLASAPRADKRLDFFIRQVGDGVMSRYWFGEAKPNDLLRVDGPRGSFFLRELAGLDLVLLATGTGIAPIKAMLEELALRPADQQPRRIRLLWGGRHPQDLFWQRPDSAQVVDYVPVLSRADASWAGARGHVQNVLLDQPDLDLARSRVYACGSNAMIQGAQAALTAAGLDPRHFHSDAFLSSE